MCKQIPVYVYACGCVIKRLPLEGKGEICLLKMQDAPNTRMPWRRRKDDKDDTFCREVGDARLLTFHVTGKAGGDLCFTKDASGNCPNCAEEAHVRAEQPDAPEKEVRRLARAALAEEGWDIPQVEKAVDVIINQSIACSKTRVQSRAREITANASRRLGKILVYRPTRVVLEENPDVVLDMLSEIASLPDYVDKAYLMWKAGSYVAARYGHQKQSAQARAALLGYEEQFADGLGNKWLSAKERAAAGSKGNRGRH